MRKACLLALNELARQDKRVVFIGSDITNRDLEAFARDFPERFFMEGIYEQHIVGMAAGMALSGKIPYINTIATFLTRRCYEQLLLDVCLHKLPVRLIGSGGGVVYAPLGPTHLAFDDLAILRAIPNMTIVAPCDAEEMRRLMPATLAWPGPIYIRLAKGGDKVVSRPDVPFVIGKAMVMREGADVLLVTTGVTTQIALEAAAALAGTGLACTVLHLHTVKPLDWECVLAYARTVKAVITVEEHTLVGGLGSAVAEMFMETGVNRTAGFARLGFPDVFPDDLGSQADLMGQYGISAAGVIATVKRLVAEPR